MKPTFAPFALVAMLFACSSEVTLGTPDELGGSGGAGSTSSTATIVSSVATQASTTAAATTGTGGAHLCVNPGDCPTGEGCLAKPGELAYCAPKSLHFTCNADGSCDPYFDMVCAIFDGSSVCVTK